MSLSTKFLTMAAEFDGWLTAEEGQALADAAREVPGDQHIVEIGAFAGRSAAWLLAGASKGHKPSITCIDPWNPDCIPGSPGKQLAEAVHHLFRVNTQAVANLLDTDPPHEWWCRSDEVEWSAEERIGLLFIDSAKTTEQMEGDYTRWSGWIAAGGRLIFHDDHRSHKDVQRFFRAWMVHNKKWADEGRPAGSIRVFRRVA